MIQAERPMRTAREERGKRTPYGSRVFEGENMVSCAGFLTNKCFMILLSVLQVLKGRFTSKEQYHHEQLLNLAYKESKDEFEDPDNLKRSKCPN